MHPYEFKRLAPGDESLPIPPQKFVTELGLLLEREGLSDIIGLQVYTDGIVGVESTDHDTNVSTTVDHEEKAMAAMDTSAYQNASFAFF